MKKTLNDLALLGLLGIAAGVVALMTGCTVEGGTDNRSTSDAHGSHSGTQIHINSSGTGS